MGPSVTELGERPYPSLSSVPPPRAARASLAHSEELCPAVGRVVGSHWLLGVVFLLDKSTSSPHLSLRKLSGLVKH